MEQKDYVGISLPHEKHQQENRTFQGIPGIAVSPEGRIFTVCYTGGSGEGSANYVVVWISDDKGLTWSKPVAVVDPLPDDLRAFDSVPWIAPDGKLYLFWTQSHAALSGRITDGTNGVWFAVLENPDDPIEKFRWSKARRIADGVMMNAPITLRDGSWLLPVSVWENKDANCLPPAPGNGGTKCFASDDNGATFYERGRFHLPEDWRIFDEHSFVELSDGRIRCVARTLFGNADAWSNDGGRTWSNPVKSDIPGPNSRLFIIKLKSGRLLLVNNHDPDYTGTESWRPRRNMTAFLSDDDGATWYGGLQLDARNDVSYPDGQQAADGSIWIVHDYARCGGCEIVVSHFTEADVAAGKLVSPDSRLGIIASKSKPIEK